MKKQISIAKITPPKLSGVFFRKRLFKLLDEARNKPVVWITAPPGAGKTTLISTYLEHKNLPCLWYQIDEGDGDIASFFHYMGIAVKKAAPRYHKSMPNLTPEYLLGLPTFTRNYFRELYIRVSKSQSIKESKRSDTPAHRHSDTKSKFIIVLDNYQDAPADSPLHEIIQTGLSEIPEGINVIIISRTEPPLAFAGLRANNKMNTFGWNDLSLSIDETYGIARLKGIKKPSEELVQQLHDRVNGWAAGLVLMLEHQGSADLIQRHGAGFTTQAMFDYFAGEIFHKLDAASQEILLQTAFLPIMTARFAQQVTGSHQAGELLSELNRRNYFTIRKSLPEPVYQYHPLFREFLLAQARQQLAPAQLIQTMRRAAEILEGTGQAEDAVTLYSHAADWASMARIILASAQIMIEQGRFRTLLEWIERLPKDFVEQNAHLLFWKGAAVMSMSPAASRENLEHSFALFKKERDVAGMLFCFPAIVNAYIHEWNDLTGLGRWIEEMDELMQSSPAFPSQELEARVAVAMVSALSFCQLGHPRIEAWVKRLHSLMNGIEDPNLHIHAVIQLAFFYSLSGRLAEFEVEIDRLRHASSAISPFNRIASILPQIIHAWQVLASHEEGVRLIAEGLRIAESTGVHVLDYSIQIQGIYCALTTENLKDAERLIASVAPDSHDTRILNRSHYCYKTGWLAWLRGDLAAADALLQEAHSLTLRSGSPFYVALTLFGLAQVNISAKELKKAEAYLDEVQPIVRELRSPIMEFIYLVLRTQTALAGIAEAGPGSPQKKPSDDFLPLLRQTLALGREQGYMNFPWWHSGIMAMLCVRALEHGIEVEYVQKLIKARNIIPEKPPVNIENWPWPVRIYTLGRFAIVKDGKPLRFTEKAKHMPLKLLKAIIALGGRDVGAELVIDTLWPDADGDTGLRSLNTTLHRLRKLLGDDMAITLEDNRLTIDVRHVWVDVFAFQRLMGKIENILKKAEAKDDNLNHLMERIIAMYQGPFLRDISEQWALSFRERLKNRCLYILAELAQRFEQSKDWQKAIQCCEKCVEIDNISEENYRRLMTVHNNLGRKSEGLAVYKRCKEALNLHLGISPSQETEAIHKSLRS